MLKQEIPVKNIGTGDKSEATCLNTPVITASETAEAVIPVEIRATAVKTIINKRKNIIPEII
jgi:hypothetical protein